MVTGAVQLNKPWYFSKKMYVGLIGAALGVWVAVTGKPAETLPEVLDKIQTAATVIGPIIALLLAIAKVDLKERDLVMGLFAMAKTIGTPDDPNAVAVALQPDAPPPPSVANPPGLTRSP